MNVIKDSLLKAIHKDKKAAMIWNKKYSVDELNEKAGEENILNRLGIEFLEVGEDYITARMPVDDRTRQPYGILHGGATCVLTESLGSFASVMMVDLDKKFAVGSHVSCNHLRPMKKGFVTATCRPVHLGRTKHVWDITVENEEGKPVAKSELTCAVIDNS